jgi:DVNP family
MPNSRRNSLGRNHNKHGRFTSRSPRKMGSQTRKSSNHSMTIGSRAQVFHGTAHHTSGGLTKDKLMQKKDGKIVSRRASAAGKKALKRLTDAGYIAKKGEFKLFKKQ